MAESLDLEIAGERLRFLAGRAVYWPERRRLFIADLHLGKADAFRAAGIAVPRGGTATDLGRLSALIDQTNAASLWVLGDLLHGALSDAPWRQDWSEFREKHSAIELGLIAGNHDRALRKQKFDFELIADAVPDGPFLFSHGPQPSGELHNICGHIHPVVRLPGLKGRFPMFWLQTDRTVLPAFSLFTGGFDPAVAAEDRYLVCADNVIVQIG